MPKERTKRGVVGSLFYPMGLASRPIKLLRFAGDFLLFCCLLPVTPAAPPIHDPWLPPRANRNRAHIL